MAFLQHAKGLFSKKATTPTSEPQIGSPNGNGLQNDADAKIPVVNGLIRSQQEQAKLGGELIASGLKAVPVKSQISAPNKNGLRDDANARIPVKNGLVRSPEEQQALMMKLVAKDVKTTPPAPLTKPAEVSPKIERRETIYKPMPQNVGVVSKQAESPEDILKSEFDGLLADLKRDNEARAKTFETRTNPDNQGRTAPAKMGGPASQGSKPNSGDRPVPPPKPEKFRSAPANTLNMPKSPAVTSPQQPRQPELSDRAKHILAESALNANALKGNQATREQHVGKPTQSTGLGKKK